MVKETKGKEISSCPYCNSIIKPQLLNLSYSKDGNSTLKAKCVNCQNSWELKVMALNKEDKFE